MKPEYLYRFDVVTYWLGVDSYDKPLPARIHKQKFPIIKRTEKGVWIHVSGLRRKRFVLLSGKKRYAYPTEEEALTSLYKRKNRQVQILKAQLEKATTALNVSRTELERMERKTC